MIFLGERPFIFVMNSSNEAFAELDKTQLPGKKLIRWLIAFGVGASTSNSKTDVVSPHTPIATTLNTNTPFSVGVPLSKPVDSLNVTPEGREPLNLNRNASSANRSKLNKLP